MTRRLMLTVVAMVAVFTLQGLAHEGHDHKVLCCRSLKTDQEVAVLLAEN